MKKKFFAMVLAVIFFVSHTSKVFADTAGDVAKGVAAAAALAALIPPSSPPKTYEYEDEVTRKIAKRIARLKEKQNKEVKKQLKDWENFVASEEIENLKNLAEGGDVQAQCILSYAYLTGQGVKINRGLAYRWEYEAKRTNKDLVQNFIPVEYYETKKIPLTTLYAIAGKRAHAGQYVPQDYDEAIRWSKLAASKGDLSAISYLGSAYYTGRGVEQDVDRAIDYFYVTLHEPLSLTLLADAYNRGNGVKKNPDKAKLFEEYLNKVESPKREKKIEKILKRNARKIKAGGFYGIVR